ncbi:MAG: type II secretion system protein N [Gallionella sp.]
MKRLPLVTSFALFIALCVSGAYWAMQLFNPPQRAVAPPPQTSQPAPSLDAAATLLGGQSPAVVASNFQLTGVVMASDPADSVAILVANGKKPQAVRTNAEVVPGVTVKEVQHDHVLLSEGGVIKRVDLPIDAKRTNVSLPAYSAANPVTLPGGARHDITSPSDRSKTGRSRLPQDLKRR